MNRREIARDKVLIAAFNRGIKLGHFPVAWKEGEVLTFNRNDGERFSFGFELAGLAFEAQVDSYFEGREFAVSAWHSDGSRVCAFRPLKTGQHVAAHGFFERERGVRLLTGNVFRCRPAFLSRIADAPVMADGFFARVCDRERAPAELLRVALRQQ